MKKANNYLAVWRGSCHHPASRVSTASHSNKAAEKVQHQATNSCAVVPKWQNNFELLFTSFVSSNVSKVCSLSGGKEVLACSLILASWAECAGTAQRAAVQRHAINLQHLSRWAGGSRKQEHRVQHQSADPQQNWEILQLLVLLWDTWRAHRAPFIVFNFKICDKINWLKMTTNRPRKKKNQLIFGCNFSQVIIFSSNY